MKNTGLKIPQKDQVYVLLDFHLRAKIIGILRVLVFSVLKCE